MTFAVLIVLFALVGILFLLAAVRRLRRRKILGGLVNGAPALLLLLLSVCAALLAAHLHSRQHLRIDPWDLAHRYRSWLPWLDAIYGSATFLPMADGALYEIKVSQSGLIARPLNQAARAAVGGWH